MDIFDSTVKIQIIKTFEFSKWFEELPEKSKMIVNARLQRIAIDNHFGFINVFDDLIELKWTSGMRVYTHRFTKEKLIILLGGSKNGQNKDINKAKKILFKLLKGA